MEKHDIILEAQVIAVKITYTPNTLRTTWDVVVKLVLQLDSNELFNKTLVTEDNKALEFHL